MSKTDADRFPLRMRDLVQETGVPAGTLHFYAASGLLPDAHKTSRTSVRYPRSTVARVRWIRSVQQELRLPLRAIRWVLGELGQVPVSELRTRLALGEMLDQRITAPPPPRGPKAAAKNVADLERLGLVSPTRGGRRSEADRRLIQINAAMRAAGFNEDNGFSNDQLLLYRDTMRELVRAETRRIVDAGRRLGPVEASALVERGMPLIDELVRHFHQRAITESLEVWRSLTRPDAEDDVATA